MLYISKEIIPMNVNYHIYRIKNDSDCSLVTLRIIYDKPHNDHQRIFI